MRTYAILLATIIVGLLSKTAAAATEAQATAALNAANSAHNEAYTEYYFAEAKWVAAGIMWDEAVDIIASFIPMNAMETEVKAEAQEIVASGDSAMTTGNTAYNLAETKYDEGMSDYNAADNKRAMGINHALNDDPVAAAAAFDEAITLANSAKEDFEYAEEKYALAYGLYQGSYNYYLTAYNLIVDAFNAR